MTPRTRPTIVVALHDGFYGCGTGAGYTNHALLQTLVQHHLSHTRLVVLPVHLARHSNEYDPAWHTATTTLLDQVNATVYPVENGTGGMVRFGGLDNLRHLVQSTSDTFVHHILPSADPVLILALDAPFLGLAPLLPPKAVPNLVLVPRSSGRIHTPDDRERIAWESYGLLTTAEHGGHIAAISRYMHTHLSREYQVPDDALVNLPDGLTSADWQLSPPGTDLLPAAAHDGFLLAIGRAQPYKGFDDLLDAITLLRQQNVTLPHLVLAAVTDTPRLCAYQQHLAAKVASRRLDITLLTRFHPDIRRLLTHPALRGVAVPSRAEPFGRIPLESYAAGAVPVIATTGRRPRRTGHRRPDRIHRQTRGPTQPGRRPATCAHAQPGPAAPHP